jgi:hypothetical protein
MVLDKKLKTHEIANTSGLTGVEEVETWHMEAMGVQ